MNNVSEYCHAIYNDIASAQTLAYVQRSALSSFIFSVCVMKDLSRAAFSGSFGALTSVVHVVTAPLLRDIAVKVNLRETFMGAYQDYLFAAINITITYGIVKNLTGLKIDIGQTIFSTIALSLVFKKVFQLDIRPGIPYFYI